MRKLITSCLLAAPLLVWSQAQCPVLLNCPQGSPVICDISSNDPQLWQDAPYTWSQVLQTADLYEGTVDFSIKVKPCAGGGNVNISYVLLLDLNNDNLRESAVWSESLPPAGIVYSDNAFNPDYTGGLPVQFDQRPVPDSMKYGFALEITQSWDTLIASLRFKSGSAFLSPRLPEGRHSLRWRVEQDGKVKYCEHSFRLKDCQAPTLECAPAWGVAIDSNGMATLRLDEIPPAAEDNTTPYSLLAFSMRPAGAGSGFPLDSTSQPVTTLHYSCENLDSPQQVEVWARDRLDNAQSCLTNISIEDNDGYCEEVPLLCARTFWGDHEIVKPVRFSMLWVEGADSAQQLITRQLPALPGGCAEMDYLPSAGAFSLTALCDSNHLNGVSTFDLLLISKHILGIQLFDAPWKWLAADVNKSNSVTTFDVVELRKLILGIYNKLPVNTSWRLFAADCDFPANPFSAYCPNEYSFVTMPLWNYPAEILFNAVKTGDVNGTANPVSLGTPVSEARGEPLRLQLPDLILEAGKTCEISLQIPDAETLSGCQFALRFDPDVLEIESVDPGVLPDLDQDAFARPEPGLLHFSWFHPVPQAILPGQSLLRLRVRALRAGRLQDAARFDTGRIAAEAYPAEASVLPLRLIFAAPVDAAAEQGVFAPRPNPTAAGVRIPLRLAEGQNVTVEIADAAGKNLYRQVEVCSAGPNLLDIPASAFPATGIYVWRLTNDRIFQSGRLVRM